MYCAASGHANNKLDQHNFHFNLAKPHQHVISNFTISHFNQSSTLTNSFLLTRINFFFLDLLESNSTHLWSHAVSWRAQHGGGMKRTTRGYRRRAKRFAYCHTCPVKNATQTLFFSNVVILSMLLCPHPTPLHLFQSIDLFLYFFAHNDMQTDFLHWKAASPPSRGFGCVQFG